MSAFASYGALGGSLLFASTLGADNATIDTGANGISDDYENLLISIYARTTDAVVNSSAVLRFNNDSAGNYDYSRGRNDNTTFTGTSDVAQTGIVLRCPGANVQAGSFGASRVWVPKYPNTVGHKGVEAVGGVLDSSAANCSIVMLAGRWRSTAAISRVAISAGGGNFLAGTSLSIYGLR